MTVSLTEAGAERPQDVSYSYWPVHYPGGDPTVISNRPLPLSGVKYSNQARDVGQLRASLQLHDQEVRDLNPWELMLPRQTGIVAVRTVTTGGIPNHRAVWHGVLWEAPTVPDTGRMELTFETVESLWARRRITGPPPIGTRDSSGELLPDLSWDGADQAQIVRDLLNPNKFSQFGLRPRHGGLRLSGERFAEVAYTLNHSDFAITGDIDIRVEITPDTWRPDVARGITRKYITTEDQRSWAIWLQPTGQLRARWSTDGATFHTITSPEAVPESTERLTIRWVLQVDNGSAEHAVGFYTAPGMTGPWTELGAPETRAGTTSVFASNARIEVGRVTAAQGQGFPGVDSQPWAGTIQELELRNGIDGDIVTNPKFDQQTIDTTSFTDNEAKVWTLSSSASIAVGGEFPGWITVEAPQENMGVPRDMTYRRGQQTPLLRAHQDRSKVINGYEWYTTLRVLEGQDAYSATKFRLQFVWGYPRLGRVYSEDDIPRFSYHVDGRGNIVTFAPVHDGTGVSNVVWGTGSGYDTDAVRAVSWFSGDWDNGFLVTEDSYSNPDVSRLSTLQDQTDTRLIQSYADERFIDKITVRGDLLPHFDTYAIGDDCLVTADDWTWPDNPDGSRGVTFLSRIMGWTVTPPEGSQAEHVELLISTNPDAEDADA